MERYVVVGLGAFGTPVARRLADRNQDVLAIDSDERLIEEIKDHVSRAVVADASDPETLLALGVKDYSTAVVAIGTDLESSVIVTAVLQEMGMRRIVARATSPIHARILGSVGAHTVVSPETEFAMQLADNLVSTFSMERIPLAEGIVLAEFPAHPSMHGKTLRDLNLRERFGVHVVAVQTRRTIEDAEGRKTSKVELAGLPEPGRPIEEGEILVLLGPDAGLQGMTEAYGD